MKRSRMRRRSKKMAKLYSKGRGRREFVAFMLQKYPRCQANTDDCSLRSTQVHERLNRSQGAPLVPDGDWTSPKVLEMYMALCFECHHRITFNPQWALEQGFRIRRYG